MATGGSLIRYRIMLWVDGAQNVLQAALERYEDSEKVHALTWTPAPFDTAQEVLAAALVTLGEQGSLW